MPLPENNILFYWTAPNGAPFSVRVSLRTAHFCVRGTQKYTLSAQGIFRDVHAAAKYAWTYSRLSGRESVRLLQPPGKAIGLSLGLRFVSREK